MAPKTAAKAEAEPKAKADAKAKGKAKAWQNTCDKDIAWSMIN